MRFTRHTPVQFTVRPRYSAGSGALVSEAIAIRVARQEREGYDAACSGIYGAAARERAERVGLGTIVLMLVERPKAWHVYDLLTGAWQVWPFAAKCPTCGERVSCRDGRAQEHSARGSVRPCTGAGRYLGATLPLAERWQPPIDPPQPEAAP